MQKIRFEVRINRTELIWNVGFVVAFLPIIILRDMTPANELRYLSIADEALRDHTFWTFHNHGVVYADKPPLFLWGIMALRRIAGCHVPWLAVLLFSFLPALGTANIMSRWASGRRYVDPGLPMLLTTGLFMGASIVMRMDMIMCLFIVLALRSFWNIATGTGGKNERRLFPVWLFLALFTKGPLGILIPLCVSAVWLVSEHRIREFATFWGWKTFCPLLAGCVIWFLAVYIEGGKEYLWNLLFHQTVDRAVNSFHHDGPVYYYAVCTLYCLAPWTLSVVVGVVTSFRRPGRVDSLTRFFITAGVVTLVLLSILSSKLQIYMLPAIPFLVYGAGTLMPCCDGQGWVRAGVALPAFLFVLAFPGILMARHFGVPENCVNHFMYVSAAVLSVAGIAGLSGLFIGTSPGKSERAVGIIAGGLLVAIFIGGWSIPAMNPFIGYKAVCEKAVELSQEEGIREIRVWRMSRADNMDVYLQAPVEFIDDDARPSQSDAPYILLTVMDEAVNLLGAETYAVGPYAVVIVEPHSGIRHAEKP